MATTAAHKGNVWALLFRPWARKFRRSVRQDARRAGLPSDCFVGGSARAVSILKVVLTGSVEPQLWLFVRGILIVSGYPWFVWFCSWFTQICFRSGVAFGSVWFFEFVPGSAWCVVGRVVFVFVVLWFSAHPGAVPGVVLRGSSGPLVLFRGFVVSARGTFGSVCFVVFANSAKTGATDPYFQ